MRSERRVETGGGDSAPGPARRGMAARAALALTLVVGACAGFGEPWTLAGRPGLMTQVRQFYHWNASEEGGYCPAPIMEAVTRERVLEENPERLEVLVRYAYRDWIRDGDDDCSRLRPGRCFLNVPCRGYNERTFLVDLSGPEPKVVDMSGELRRPEPVNPRERPSP